MEKFVVTFVDGTQCVCYRNEDQQSPTQLVDSLLTPTHMGATYYLGLTVQKRLWKLGVENPDTDVGPLGTTHLPRCYLNTERGRDRLRLLACSAFCQAHQEI